MKKDYPQDTEEMDLVDFPCTCPLLDSGDCRMNAALNVILPKINLGGAYQVVTGSFYSITQVNSQIGQNPPGLVRGMFALARRRRMTREQLLEESEKERRLLESIAMIPLKLKRIEQKIQYKDKPPRPHWILSIEFSGNEEAVDEIIESRKLAPPKMQQFALPAPTQVEPGEIVDDEGTVEAQAEKVPESPGEKSPDGGTEGGSQQTAAGRIIADLRRAENRSEFDAFWRKNLLEINTLSNEWKLKIAGVKEEILRALTKTPETRKERPESADLRDELIKEIVNMNKAQLDELKHKYARGVPGLAVEDQLKVSHAVQERYKAIEEIEKKQQGKLL